MESGGGNPDLVCAGSHLPGVGTSHGRNSARIRPPQLTVNQLCSGSNNQDHGYFYLHRLARIESVRSCFGNGLWRGSDGWFKSGCGEKAGGVKVNIYTGDNFGWSGDVPKWMVLEAVAAFVFPMGISIGGLGRNHHLLHDIMDNRRNRRKRSQKGN